jgi:hypothetical protein
MVEILKCRPNDKSTYTTENFMHDLRYTMEKRVNPLLSDLARINADTNEGTFAKCEIFAFLVCLQHNLDTLGKCEGEARNNRIWDAVRRGG